MDDMIASRLQRKRAGYTRGDLLGTLASTTLQSTTQRLRMAFAQAAKSEAELMEALVQGGCSSRCCECIGKKAKPHRMWS